MSSLVTMRTPEQHRFAPKAARSLTTMDSIRRECLRRIKKERQERVWRRRSSEPTAKKRSAREVLDDVLGGAEKRLRFDFEEELMLELEEEIALEAAESYTEELEREARLVEEAGAWHEANDDDRDLVLCPVCSQSYLTHHRGLRSFFECSHCHTRIADAGDGLGLPQLRYLLAQAFENHRLSGCDANPVFEPGPTFDGFSILMARCHSCAFYSAIM